MGYTLKEASKIIGCCGMIARRYQKQGLIRLDPTDGKLLKSDVENFFINHPEKIKNCKKANLTNTIKKQQKNIDMAKFHRGWTEWNPDTQWDELIPIAI